MCALLQKARQETGITNLVTVTVTVTAVATVRIGFWFGIILVVICFNPQCILAYASFLSASVSFVSTHPKPTWPR